MKASGQTMPFLLERRSPTRRSDDSAPESGRTGSGRTKTWSKIKVLPILLTFFIPVSIFAAGQVIYDASKAVELGRELGSQLRAATPEAGFTNSGTLHIKVKRQPLVMVAYTCRVQVTPTNWTSHYSAVRGTNALAGFSVEHHTGRPNIYRDDAGKILSDSQLDVAFAGSDFWLSDLGLEFFHWPEQRVPRWEMARSSGCKVLESTNPTAPKAGYSRVVSWIGDESGGIVQAEAYDAKGKLLKEFRPTVFEEVNGEWQLKEMEMRNIQTGSRSTLILDLKSP